MAKNLAYWSRVKILFICRGNVGRSQMAAAIFDQLTNYQHQVSSAGTKVVNKEGESRQGQKLKDLPPAENVILTLGEAGINSADNVRSQLDPSLVEWADLIVSMAEPETAPNYLADSAKMIYWAVPDPKGTPLDEHRKVRDQITELIEKFIIDKNLKWT
jgi:arsenate reductase (thioredoxin)